MRIPPESAENGRNHNLAPLMTNQRVLLLGLASITILLWGVVILRHGHKPAPAAQSALRAANPTLSERIEGQISNLKQETVQRSVENLSDLNMFFWPGPTPPGFAEFVELPLSAKADFYSVEAIMSNRRFRKVLGDLGRLDKHKASQIVGGQLSNAVSEYLPLYAGKMAELTNYHRVSDTNGGIMGAGMPFVSGAMVLNVSNVSDLTNLPIFKHVNLEKIPIVTNPSVASNLLGMNSNHVVIMGARLKVLSLTWVAGLLELHELNPELLT